MTNMFKLLGLTIKLLGLTIKLLGLGLKIAALAVFLLVALTGCEEWPGGWPMAGQCNNGIGFVEDLCSGPALEPGSLEIGIEVNDRMSIGAPIHWELRYDRANLVGVLDTTVWDPLAQVNTPGVISEGDLEVRAVIDGQQAFCEANSAGMFIYAENNGLEVEFREYQRDDDCYAKIRLDDFIVNN